MSAISIIVYCNIAILAILPNPTGTGGRRHSTDLPQGGLKNSCKLPISDECKEIKFEHLLSCKATSVTSK